MPLKTGEATKFEVALQSKLIKDSTFDEVKEVLRLVMLKLGIRANNLPNDIEKLVLYEHITEYYGGNTVSEIKLAFEMAMMGKLGIDDINCYENFTCAYFSKIMNAYRQWATEEYKVMPTEKPTEQKIFSQQELEDGFREDVERQYQMFLKGFALKALELNKPILVKDGLMKESQEVIKFFITKMENGAKNIYVKK